jgi:hypothetical protein
MKNKIEDLRNHLFAQLERLGNEELKPEKLEIEIKRAKSLKEVAQVIVNTAKVEVDFYKAAGSTQEKTSFISLEAKNDSK